MENIANVSKRISAYLLDICLIYLFMSLITGIRFINPTYDNLVETTNEYQEVLNDYTEGKITEEVALEQQKDYVYKVTKYGISTNVAVVLVIFAYFGIFQKFNNGQTLGKKIMKIKVVSNDDKNLSVWSYFLRILPIYYIFIGSVIPLILTSILVFIVGSTYFATVNSIIVYLFFGIGIMSFVMMNVRKDKRGLQDLISGTKVVFE